MPISFSPPADRELRARGAGVTAVLGPTNTGKTHLAIERMLAHSSGLIGLPLRLLAREVYNRAVERSGADAVALITGEEKIKPPNPRFWVATVEAMPRDLDTAFVAVDEIQLAADFERGHVFTDRMLHRRGREETLVLGAATMRPIVERLLPGASIISRPRLSTLSFAGEKKLTRLPHRSAIVAFSTEEVYAIAELIRRQRGGAAVVLGALSPRTRNAQVELYQSGEVDYLVATDAIGMGLNLDVDHIAFASDRKFDGYQFRKLNPVEFAQIAGRAGRATRDGTFGTTGRCPPFEPELAQALEAHTFEPVKLVQWRNTDLDFSSIGALQATLAAAPTEAALARAPVAEDILVLDHAAREDEVRALTRTRADVERLWDVCQIPDYRKIAPANHAELVIAVYGFLMRDGRIDTDWFARQIATADRTDGDIDTLSTRIAHIRTWTFAANRPDWLADPEHWQEVTRGVEDKLSDALHERLTERFVDRRTSVLMRRLRENAELEPQINKTGEVIVEGHVIGRLDGFVFVADAASRGSEAKALQNAAQKALAGEIAARATRLAAASDEQFVLASDGMIRWTGTAIGKLLAGEEVLRPRLRLIADEQLTGAPRDGVQERLDIWLKTYVEKVLGPLFELSAAADVTGIARGVAFQIVEALGVLERTKVADEVKGLQQPDRATLRKYGVRFGAYHVYTPALLKPGPRALAVQLWALSHGEAQSQAIDELLHLAASGRTSIPVNRDIDPALYRMAGYRVCGERAVRVDILERLADLIRPALAWRDGAPGPKPAAAFPGGGFTVINGMTSLIGAAGEDFASVLRSLSYRMELRPKPPEPAPPQKEPEIATEAAASPDAVSSSNQAEASDTDSASSEIPSAEIPSAEIPSAEIPSAESPLPESPEIPSPPPAESPLAADEPRTIEATGTEAESTTEAAAAAEGPDNSMAAAPQEITAAEPAAETATEPTPAAAEPIMVEVWRPSRSDRPRRLRERHRDSREHRTATRGEAAAPAQHGEAQTAEAPPAEEGGTAASGRSERQPRYRRRQDRDHRRDRTDRPDRPDRPPREQDRRPPRPARFDRREREKAPDPNSPFAKLAALKAQLEAEAKERR
jgi:ATP-dependent RNA helicase SUPV3L1/SUV3